MKENYIKKIKKKNLKLNIEKNLEIKFRKILK